MGFSSQHSSTVALVRNFTTNIIIPQFHVIFDDDFETVRTEEDLQPLIWEELVTFNSFRSTFDDYSFVPAMGKYWLDEEELSNRLQMDSIEVQKRGEGSRIPRQAENNCESFEPSQEGTLQSNNEDSDQEDSTNEKPPLRRS